MIGPLPLHLQRSIERLFQRDFRDVHIHISPQPGRYGAAAFAAGREIHIQPESYNPQTPEGLRLLVHEFTHIVQQEASGPKTGTPVLLDNPELEREADRLAARAHIALRSGESLDVRCRIETGRRVVQPLVLRAHTKQSLYNALTDLVKQLAFVSAYTVDLYVDALYEWLMERPAIFSGEKHKFSNMSPTKNSKLPYFTWEKDGARVNLKDLDRQDLEWIRKTIEKLAYKYRFKKNYSKITTRILDDHEKQWVKWETSDCVFSAIQISMGLRFTGKGPVEAAELAVATALADALEIPKAVVEDHVMQVLLEERLSWPRMVHVKDLATLNANAVPNNTYVVSYCENASTDFWHTVYGKCTGLNKWSWVDRQYERKFGVIRATLPTELSTEASAWQIDPDSALLGILKTQLNVAALKVKYAEYL